MTADDRMPHDYPERLRAAIERAAGDETDWNALHARVAGGPVAGRLAELRRRASGGARLVATAGATWWDYAARAAMAAVPLGLAAAVLLFAYLRSAPRADDELAWASTAAGASSADSARMAFESVLTGDQAPRAVIGSLMPAPASAFLAEAASAGAP
jgi:hypothetical protein